MNNPDSFRCLAVNLCLGKLKRREGGDKGDITRHILTSSWWVENGILWELRSLSRPPTWRQYDRH